MHHTHSTSLSPARPIRAPCGLHCPGQGDRSAPDSGQVASQHSPVIQTDPLAGNGDQLSSGACALARGSFLRVCCWLVLPHATRPSGWFKAAPSALQVYQSTTRIRNTPQPWGLNDQSNCFWNIYLTGNVTGKCILPQICGSLVLKKPELQRLPVSWWAAPGLELAVVWVGGSDVAALGILNVTDTAH